MLAPGIYSFGTEIRIFIDFTDTSGAAVDPATVTLKTLDPLNGQTTYTYGTDANVGKSAVGSYYADITPDVPGRWVIRWETTGTGTKIVKEDSILIQESPFYSPLSFWWDYS